MHDHWRDLNKLHTEICSLSVHFEAGRHYKDGLRKNDGKGNWHGV